MTTTGREMVEGDSFLRGFASGYCHSLVVEDRVFLSVATPGPHGVEKRTKLLKYGKAIGRAIDELVSIVSPATFYRWFREAKSGKPKPKKPKGGQRKPKELCELVLAIANETGFGFPYRP